MLEDYYTEIAVYREVDQTNAWGNLEEQANWQYDHMELGFLQPRSGSYAQVNQRMTPTSDHVLYCDIDVDIVTGDRLLLNSKYYNVDFVQSNGIGGIGDHQEINCSVRNDMP